MQASKVRGRGWGYTMIVSWLDPTGETLPEPLAPAVQRLITDRVNIGGAMRRRIRQRGLDAAMWFAPAQIRRLGIPLPEGATGARIYVGMRWSPADAQIDLLAENVRNG